MQLEGLAEEKSSIGRMLLRLMYWPYMAFEILLRPWDDSILNESLYQSTIPPPCQSSSSNFLFHVVFRVFSPELHP